MVARKTRSQPARYALAGRDFHPQDDADLAQRTPVLNRPVTDIQIAMIYAHLAPDHLASAVEKLPFAK